LITEKKRTHLQKKKLSDMLGSQWSKEELERFYGAYRKYGKDWRKIAGAIRDRTSDMVEALYNMNKLRIGHFTLYNHSYFHLIT